MDRGDIIKWKHYYCLVRERRAQNTLAVSVYTGPRDSLVDIEVLEEHCTLLEAYDGTR